MPPYLLRRLLVAGVSTFVCLGAAVGFTGPRIAPLPTSTQSEQIAATAKKYGAATVYWDNGTTDRYGFGLFNRRSLTVTQQGIINAIMSGVGSRAAGQSLPSGG